MIFGQTFAFSDVPKIFILTFLELALSADNAIILGTLTHSLLPQLRKKALFIGALSSIFLRAAALLSVSFLLQYLWIQLVGAAYLLYLSIRHFAKKRSSSRFPKPTASFWKTVMIIEGLDLIFAIDSIVAGVAFIGPTTSSFHPKLWIVYFGGVIGLVLVRYAAHFFSLLIDRFPRLYTSAYLLIGWVGVELAFNAFSFSMPYYNWLFWGGAFLLLLLGFCSKK